MYVNPFVFLYGNPTKWKQVLLHELAHMSFFVWNYDYIIAMYKDTKMLDAYCTKMFWEDQAETFVLWYYIKFGYLKRLNERYNDKTFKSLYTKIMKQKRFISNRLGWFDKFEKLGLKPDFKIKKDIKITSSSIQNITIDETSLTDNGFFKVSV